MQISKRDGRGAALAFGGWLVFTGAAWSLGSRLLVKPGISDPAQIRAIAIDLALHGLPIGVLVGVGGALFLRRFLRGPLLWAASSIVALPLGVTAGFLLDAAFLYRQVHAMGMALSGEGGGAFMWTSPAIDLTFAGLIFALCQLCSLAPGLAARPARAALWVIGTAAALGIAWFVSAALTEPFGQGSLLQGAAMGVVSGALMYALLLTMGRDSGGGR